MAIIFNSDAGKDNRGRVTVLEQEGVTAGSIMSLETGSGVRAWSGFSTMKAIFTRADIARSTNHQFRHMLGDTINLYVFGDRVGSLGLSGVAFHDNCTSSDDKIGMTHVVDFFDKYKLSEEAAPLRVNLDPTVTFECYLHSVRGQTINAANRMYQFHLQLALLPSSTPREMLPATGGPVTGEFTA